MARPAVSHEPAPELLFRTLAVVGSAAALRAALVGPLGPGIPYLTFYPAVMLASLWSGLMAGLLAILASLLLVFFWVLRGRMSPAEVMAMALFAASSLGIALLVESRRKNSALARQALEDLRQANDRMREDLAKRRQIEAQSQRMHQLLLDSQALAKVGGWEVDLDSGTLFWTDETYRIHEPTPAEYSPSLESAIAFYVPEAVPVIREAVRKATLEGQAFDLELELVTARQRRIWVHANGRPIMDSGRITMVLGAIQDITGVRNAIADLRQKDRMLMAQNRLAAMGEMIGHIAHQWRQPLNALNMLLINLGDAHRYGELSAGKLEGDLRRGGLLIQNMSSTIGDFRNFFNPDKGSDRFSALEQVRAAVALVEASFMAEDVAIRIEAPEDFQLSGLPNEFSQVLLNLLSNAKHAIKEAGVQRGEVVIAIAREEGFCRLTVRDNGPGIPGELLERIFEPYFSTREGGTGIGLYMSKQIIEGNMSGRISARNLDGGAEFSILMALTGDTP